MLTCFKYLGYYIGSTLSWSLTCCKFLGCYTDSTLSWSDHINHVITQNSKVIVILRLANHYLPQFIKMLNCKLFFMSLLRYCLFA